MEQIQLKDYLRESSLTRSRLLIMVAILAILMLLLVIRIWYLQIHQHEKFAVLSKDNRVRLVPIPPVRGQIFDRDGRVLAENMPVFTLEILPLEVDDMQRLLDDLAQIIALAPEEISRFKAQVATQPSFKSQTLKISLTEQEKARIVVNQHRLTGVRVKASLQRHYPYGGELAHVVGYVGRINQQDLQSIDNAAYNGTDYIGKLGIEAKYESDLLGQVGYERIETNAHGRRVRTLDRSPSIAGRDVHLNIDAELQVKSRSYLNGKRGSVIAIEPNTGAVLAFVSNPVYDPNKFVNGIDHKSYNGLRDDINRPLLNRALNGRYAPGSTIKGLVALAGLENGWSKDAKVYCPGFFRLSGRKHQYRCWRRAGHGSLDMVSAIMQSCDVFFYQLASALGIDKLYSALSQFGLGEKTGIDLNGEPSGLMPSREWKRQVRGNAWYPGETVITGIGQGYMLVTPLQLAVMTATIANRGARLQPSLVYKTTHAEGDGNATQARGGILQAQLPTKPEDFDIIIEAMRGVVEERRGTAWRLGVDAQYSFAGKSGTAQVVAIAQGAKYDDEKLSDFEKDHALFIAFAPLQEPQIAVAVIVENGGSGSSVAGPVARKAIDYHLLGIDANAELPADNIEQPPATSVVEEGTD